MRISDTDLKPFVKVSALSHTGHLQKRNMEEKKNLKALSMFVCVSLWQIISKGSMDATQVWCNSSSHTAIYRNYTPARKARADPRHSKWSTHDWTALLNDLENSLVLHRRYKRRGEEETDRGKREDGRRTEIQQEWKKERIRDMEASSSQNRFIIDLKMCFPFQHYMWFINWMWDWYECVALWACMWRHFHSESSLSADKISCHHFIWLWNRL